jgi:hypothetical protein
LSVNADDKSWMVILFCAAIFLLTVVNNTDDDLSTPFTSDIVGQAAHPLYNSFGTAVKDFVSPNELNFDSADARRTLSFSVKDDVIYSVAYISINGSAWQPVNLSGEILSGSWLMSRATGVIRIYKENISKNTNTNNYLIVYTCSKTSTKWDCHNNKWQIRQFNTTRTPDSVCPDTCISKGYCEVHTLCNITVDCGTCTTGYVCDKGICYSSDSYDKNCSGMRLQSCNITNGIGTQSRNCTSSSWSNWSSCTFASCNTNYSLCGGMCSVSIRSCPVANGVGSQTSYCSSGVRRWNACNAVSCSSGYFLNGGACSSLPCTGSATRSCTITDGVGIQSRTCNFGNWSNWSTCTVTSCNSNYTVCDNGCSASSRSCDIPNGVGAQSGYCSSDVWNWNDACDIVSCNSGYIQNSDACVIYTPSTSYVPSTSSAIIINHTHTDISKIPSCWLDRAKLLTLHYAHTSHGGQIIEGIEYLENIDSKYAFAVSNSETEGLPAAENPVALRIYDGTLGGTYATPDKYWADPTGIGYTESVASTGHYTFSMWSWCGEQSSNSVATVNDYLSTMSSFEDDFPSMRFILMTGHTDGSNLNNPSLTLTRNNQMLRDYAAANDMVLFDFADIESWDPSGNFYPTASDGCTWCADWCNSYPSECQDMMSLGCTHSQGPLCVQKAKAFWWMMARLAGWDGVSNTCS